MAHEEKLRRAQQPTLRRLAELARLTSEPVQALLKAIGENYCNSQSLLFMIRRQVGTTDWHVKLFKRELGLTPQQLMQQCRKDTSSILLRDTSLGIEEIAELLGYQSADAFRKRHKALTGLTPSEMKACLRRVPPEQRPLVDELLSWYFWSKYHRGELRTAVLREALAFLGPRIGPS